MSPSSVLAALKQFQGQIGNIENTVYKLIQAKKMMSSELTPAKPAKHLNSQLQQTPIAIVGIASVLPQASTLQQYWENILNEVDCITEIPSSHWDVDAYYDPDPRAPDKTYCKRGGFIPEIDFNPMEFGLPPNLLEVTDTSQLLSLVVAKQAMEDAGYGESRDFDRQLAGIILGVAVGRQLATPLTARLQYPIWERVLKNSGLSDQETQAVIEKMKLAYVDWHDNAFPGLLGNVVAGRIANRLDLGGTNCTVDAACASSLAAFKMAVSELLEHRSNLMLTGGVDTDNSIFTYLCFSKTPALSPKQQSRPFDSDSDGILLGEGIGMMVLKRLADAEQDGDKIYAVIKGIGTSSDGRFKSIYAPRLEGQINALERAYQDAGIDPASVGLIEAHGTGTQAGDPTEFKALNQVLCASHARPNSIALGSVKSQIGHTKAAAGAASLIKVALALHHKILPPTINIDKPNDKLDLENSPLYLNTKSRPWIRANGSEPLRAGVSAFGFGGTNFHVVLEEYVSHNLDANPGQTGSPYRLQNVSALILLCASTPDQLLMDCDEILQKLHSDVGEQYYPTLIERCQAIDIPSNFARLGFIAESLAETCHKLKIAIDWIKKQSQLPEWEHPKGLYYRSTGLELQGKVVALFSGQGAQYLDMGKALTMNFPELRKIYGHLDGLFLQDGLNPISETVYPPPVFEEEHLQTQIEALRQTEYAQPAIGALSAGLFEIMQQAGFEPDFAAGHSFGELTALWAAKVLSNEDYFALVKARGQAMATSNAKNVELGAMLAVKAEVTQIETVIQDFPQVSIANLNSPQQAVLAGSRSAILSLQERFQSQDILATLLPVSAAFHTPLVAHAQKPFAKAVDEIVFHPPQIPVYTNVTGQSYPNQPAEIQKILKGHLLNQVLFKQEIENIYVAGGTCFVEFGPKAVLTNLVKEILGDKPHVAVALNASAQQDSDRQFREAVVQLRVKGLALGNLDPYAAPHAIPDIGKNASLNVQIGATNYVSEQSKDRFEEALQHEYPEKLTPREPQKVAAVADSVQPSRQSLPQMSLDPPLLDSPVIELPTQVSVLAPNQSIPETETQIMSDHSLNYHRLFDSVEYSLTQINQHQSETLQVHAQYLDHQMEYAKIFFQLIQQQGTLLADNAGNPELSPETQTVVVQSLDRNLSRFHDHQHDTLRVHEQTLHHQSEYSRNLFQLTHQQYEYVLGQERSSLVSPAAKYQDYIDLKTTPKPVAQPTSPNFSPPPTVTAPENHHAESPSVPSSSNGHKKSAPQPEPISRNGSGSVTAPVAKEESVSISPQPVAVPIHASRVEDLGQILLTLVSEKTGYPTEMLELEMDMEADLGIDSIRRVEILSALQERFPHSSQPEAEEVAELRTLGQIVGFMQTHLSPTPEPAPILQTANTEVMKVLSLSETATSVNGKGSQNGSRNGGATATAIAPPPPQVEIVPQLEKVSVPDRPIEARKIDSASLGETLLTIVSEKTGYPTEMLELEMDMEADLGIDSIRRVEILGAFQERFPDLPQPDPEDLTEVRTLGQIVDFLGQQFSEKKKAHLKPLVGQPS
jgi:polyketide-type polyunsaturated fatty acid synthase PfaA